MKKIRFLPILLFLGFLNNSLIYTGSSFSRMKTPVQRINIQPERSKFSNPFDGFYYEGKEYLPSEVILQILNNLDINKTDDLKSLINFSQTCNRNRDLAFQRLNLQENAFNSSQNHMSILDAIILNFSNLINLDFRKFDNFKKLIKFAKMSEHNHELVIKILDQRSNKFDDYLMNIDALDIFDAIDKKNFKEIISFHNQVNIQEKIFLNQTPLHYAILHKEPPEVIFLLLLLGANPNIQNSNGDTPLNLISKQQYNPIFTTEDHLLIISSLLFCGANPNVVNAKIESPLINLISSPLCQPKVVQLLINYGANVNYNASTSPNQPSTALTAATRIYNKESLKPKPNNRKIRNVIIKILKKSGAKI